MGVNKLITPSISKPSSLYVGSVSDTTGVATYKTALNVSGSGSCIGLLFNITNARTSVTVPCKITVDGVVQPVFNVMTSGSLSSNFKFNSSFKIELSPQAVGYYASSSDESLSYATTTATAIASIALN
jgi:hypothetical protein